MLIDLSLRILVCLLFSACGDGAVPNPVAQQTPAPTEPASAAKPGPSTSELRARRGQAMAKAVPYFSTVQPIPFHLPLLLDVIRRRFGIGKFERMKELYDEMMQEARGPARVRMRVMRRIIDRENQINPSELDSIDITSIDGLTSRALYCDRVPLPADFARRLETGMAESDYGATHVAMGLMWMRDNGCESPFTAEQKAALVDRVAAIVNTDRRITDVEIEAATFLYCLGHGDRVPPEFVDLVVSAQRADGSWPYDSVENANVGHWHTSALALWLLLEVERGSKEPMLPR